MKMFIDVNTLDITQSFWQTYPEFLAIAEFKALYDADKSKQKTDSSRSCWFVALCYHHSSVLSEAELDYRHQSVGKGYLHNSRYYQEQQGILDPLISEFTQATSTSLHRQLAELESLLERRRSFLKDQEYSLDNFEDLDKMFAATDKIEGSLSAIRTKLAAAQEGSQSKGARNLSASDQGLG